MITLNTLNQASKSDFINYLKNIYEHAPWVAEQAYALKPFSSINDLHTKMQHCVLNSSDAIKHQLICNHPELAGREASQGTLTQASQSEQQHSGLNHCSAEELQQFKQYNTDYRKHFGFPFVVAVKGLTRYDILTLMQQRLNNPKQQEFDTCISEIGKIARFRLMDLFHSG